MSDTFPESWTKAPEQLPALTPSEREQKALTDSIAGCLTVLTKMAWDEDFSPEERIEAASRVLAYAASMDLDSEDPDDDEEAFVGGPDPEPEKGDDGAC